MATLEKIRSKSVLLLVIIAVALLAFILGDFLTSGRSFFSNSTTVAEVGNSKLFGNTKININEFQRRLEEASQQAQAQGRKYDSAVLQQQVLTQMISEALFNEEMDRLGIKVTDAELSDAMLGQNAGYLNSMVQQQYGVESAAQLHDMAFNPSKYQLDADQAARLRAIWIDLEKNIEEQLRGQKLQTLFMGTLVANDLDAKALYDENASTAHILYTKKDYSSLADDKYPVTDAEINAEYAERKSRYELAEPIRQVEYIAVDITPSPADIQAGQKRVENALAGLNTKEGATGVEDMDGFLAERKSLTRGAITDQAMKSFVDSATVGKAALVSHRGNDYTLAKLMGSTSQVDSVLIDFLMVQGTRAQVAKMVADLNGGKSFADAAKDSLVAGSQDSTWIQMTAADMASLRPAIDGATLGQWFTPDTLAENGRIFRVRQRKAPVIVYDIVEVNYVLEPSNATFNKLFTDLDKYAKTNNNAKSFKENAAKAGYNVQETLVGNSSPMIGNLNETHNAVAWALDAKKGQVSPVFGEQTDDRLIAVAVADTYEDYMPASYSDVRSELETRVRNAKKGDALLKQYQGKAKDVAGYAKAMGASVDTTTVTFGQIFIPGLGPNESALTAAAAAAKKGQMVGPMKANNALVVFTVTDIETEGRPFNADESAAQFVQTRGAGALSRNIVNIIKGRRKVQNNIPHFFK